MIRSVQAGFDGKYKLGYWIPIRVTLQANETASGRLEVTVPDGDGVPTTVSLEGEQPIRLSPGTIVTETVYIKPGQAGGAMHVRFVGESGTLAEREYYVGDGADDVPRGLPATTRLVVVVGGEMGLATALRVGEEDPAVATHVTTVRSADELPDQSIGWDGVDVVVLNSSDPSVYATERFADCRQALAKWLQLGGRLYLFVGHSGETLLQEGAPLATLLPGEYVRQESLLPRYVEDLCDSQYRLPVQPTFRFSVPYLSQPEGRVESAGQNLPLVIRSIRGFGELTWVGLDVHLPPLAEWNGKPELLRRIFSVAKESPGNVDSDSGRLTSLGYTDLVGQLRAALEVFPGVRTFSFAWVIGLALVYLALLGPLDYFVVHRWGHRPVLTWLTLPIFVLVVGGGAYGLAGASKGHDARLNQVEVVDFDVPSGVVHGTVWADFYTPRHDRISLALDPKVPTGPEPGASEVECDLSWMTLPGRGLGGVEAAADASTYERGYRYGLDRARLDGLPLPMWSTKCLHASWSTETTAPIQSALTTNVDGDLLGTLVSGLDQKLTNARLYFGGRLCRLDTIEPGQSIELSAEDLWISGGNELTGRSLSKDAPPYDPAVRDARRVIQMMMWYNLAGGANYVGLANRYHARLEFSHLLEAGRAVLVAEAAPGPLSGSRMLRDGQPIEDGNGLRHIVYRFVLPVEGAP
jgi:hypothetical protein